MMKKLFAMTYAAVFAAMVSMSVTSCSLGDNDEVDNFSFEYQMDYGTVPPAKCVEMLDTLYVPDAISTSKQNAQAALLGVADSMHTKIGKILTSYDKEGYTGFSLTIRMVGDGMGVVASQTWNANAYDSYKMQLFVDSESNATLAQTTLADEIEAFNNSAKYGADMTIAEARAAFADSVTVRTNEMVGYLNELKGAGIDDAAVKLMLLGKRFEDVDSVIWK